MTPRAPEEPSFGSGFLVSLALHLAVLGLLWGVTAGRRAVEAPTGVLSVRLTPLPGGGGAPEPEKANRRPAAPKKQTRVRPKPPPPKPKPAPPKPKPKPAPPKKETPKVEPEPVKKSAPPPSKPVKTAEKPPAEEPAAPEPAEPEPPAREATPMPSEPTHAATPETEPPEAPAQEARPRGGGSIGGGSGGGAGPGGPGVSGGMVLDSPFPYAWYLEIIQRRVSSNWLKPGASARLERGAVIYFRVLRNGRLGLVEVERSSGLDLYDRSALRAVHAMGQLPPLPSGFREDYLGVHFEFLP